MKYIKHISSVQNSLIKEVLLLKEKARIRKKSGLFVLEGQRELELALKGGYIIERLFFYEDLISENEVLKLSKEMPDEVTLISVSKEVYQKIAYRETTEGIVAISVSKSHDLAGFNFDNKNPLLLIAEAPEKPGNIGALLRTADAANLDGILIANAKGDLYNPNVIRSSVGCLFTTKIGLGSTEEIISILLEKNINIYCAALSASKPYTTVDFKTAAAIVVGTEATGLTDDWLQKSTQNIIIPMRGEIDSMNVSASAAILIFEALRQREL